MTLAYGRRSIHPGPHDSHSSVDKARVAELVELSTITQAASRKPHEFGVQVGRADESAGALTTSGYSLLSGRMRIVPLGSIILTSLVPVYATYKWFDLSTEIPWG